MEYQLGINNVTDCRLGKSGWFTYTPEGWYTFKTLKGAEKKIKGMKEKGEHKNDTLQIIDLPTADDIAIHNAEIYRLGIMDLERYLNSAKFNAPDNYVNPQDIFLRLNEIKSALLS